MTERLNGNCIVQTKCDELTQTELLEVHCMVMDAYYARPAIHSEPHCCHCFQRAAHSKPSEEHAGGEYDNE
jgi:hypothetical protein